MVALEAKLANTVASSATKEEADKSANTLANTKTCREEALILLAKGATDSTTNAGRRELDQIRVTRFRTLL